MVLLIEAKDCLRVSQTACLAGVQATPNIAGASTGTEPIMVCRLLAACLFADKPRRIFYAVVNQYMRAQLLYVSCLVSAMLRVPG